MKTITRHLALIISLSVIQMAYGQTIYTYPLSSDFSSYQAGGPDLIQIPNNSGLTGEFTTRIVPASTCGQGGVAGFSTSSFRKLIRCANSVFMMLPAG